MEKGNINLGSASSLIKFQIHRHIMNLSKNFLNVLEDIDSGEDINFEKRRKRILDAAGDSYRELETQLDNLKIEYH